MLKWCKEHERNHIVIWLQVKKEEILPEYKKVTNSNWIHIATWVYTRDHIEGSRDILTVIFWFLSYLFLTSHNGFRMSLVWCSIAFICGFSTYFGGDGKWEAALQVMWSGLLVINESLLIKCHFHSAGVHVTSPSLFFVE